MRAIGGGGGGGGASVAIGTAKTTTAGVAIGSPSYAPSRSCEQCGAAMSPYLPRRRDPDTQALLCPGCSGGKTAEIDHRVLARRLFEAQASIERVAHDSGDGETIYHCPFCGAGQVVGGQDGTVTCEFCETHFTVQVQPEFAAMPQVVDGEPYPMPGMPIDKTGPGGPAPTSPPAPGDQEPGAPEEGEKPKGPVPPQFQKKTTLYVTARGVALDEDRYLRHLALAYADDRDAVLAQVRAENAAGAAPC